jgi:hypothetical protein
MNISFVGSMRYHYGAIMYTNKMTVTNAAIRHL